jgi:HEAT repeat protein
MWRRRDSDLPGAVALLVFSVEAVLLSALTWVLVLRSDGAGRVPSFAAGAMAAVAVAILLVGAHVLGDQVLSSRRERWRRHRLETWTGRWVAVLFQGATPPSGILPPQGEDALLELREALVGTEGERVEWLIRRYELGEQLVHRSRPGGGWGGRRRRLAARLDALAALAKARLASTVEPLMAMVDDREPAVRAMALRSLARTLARLPEGVARDEAAEGFADLIVAADLSHGVIEESLLLLEEAAPPVLDRLLGTPGLDDERLVRALGVIGRLRLLVLADEAGRFAAHPNPEVRAAALRALAVVGILPRGSDTEVTAGLEDPVEYVRVQATRAARLLPRPDARRALWDLLGDESWWVRRAAAQTLLHLGTDGASDLERAGRSHLDRYARHMAIQVLLDAGRLDAAGARRIRDVG